MQQKVFINRTLNLRKIKFIGFDMDHTLVRYNSQFDVLTHQVILKKLVEKRGYPTSVYSLKPQFDMVIRGLVLDRKKGNLLKVNRHGWIRKSFHGIRLIDFSSQKKIYKSIYIDLSDTEKYYAVDTAYSIPTATLFGQLVDLKDSEEGYLLPEYERIADDLLLLQDEAHKDNSLKGEVKENLSKYIIQDSSIVEGLERYIKHGKKLFVLTNSEYPYTKTLLDYTINPFLQDHQGWQDLFSLVITGSQKPQFFYEEAPFFRVDPVSSSEELCKDPLSHGIYRGGNAEKFTKDFALEGEEILYVGDHIYSDIVRLKKTCNWRTALVVEDLAHEIKSVKLAEPIVHEIHKLMHAKAPLEQAAVNMTSAAIETGIPLDESSYQLLTEKIMHIDNEIGKCIVQEETIFNRNWGELMRAGNEESFFAYQTDRFACIYMARLSDLLQLSPRNYFRAIRRPLAHEIALCNLDQ